MAEDLSYSSPSSGQTTKVHPSPLWALPCVARQESLDGSWQKEDGNGKIDDFLSDEQYEDLPNFPKDPHHLPKGKASLSKEDQDQIDEITKDLHKRLPEEALTPRRSPSGLVDLQLPRAAVARMGQEAEDRLPLEWAAAMRLIQ